MFLLVKNQKRADDQVPEQGSSIITEQNMPSSSKRQHRLLYSITTKWLLYSLTGTGRELCKRLLEIRRPVDQQGHKICSPF